MKLKILSLILVFAAFAAAFDLEIIEPEKNADIVWLGHNNPDCDSVASALACAALYGGKVYISGKLNNETRFLLQQAGCPVPEQAGDLSAARVGLVDHNQQLQSASSISGRNVLCIIDHHPLLDDSFKTPQIISMDFRPWCATTAIIADRYLKSGRPMTRQTAILLLGGILSDTTNLSDELNPREKEIVEKLTALTGLVNARLLGRKMLEAKSDYSNMSAEEVLLGDYKGYEINGKKLGFGLAETLFPEPLKLRRAELLRQLAAMKKERKLDYLFFAIKDLTAKRAYLLNSAPEEKELAAKAYSKHIAGEDDGWTILKKTSRKKFLIPSLSEALNN